MGRTLGRIEGRILAAQSIQRAAEDTEKVLKLAEMRGVDTSQLSPQEIADMVKEHREKSNG